MDLKKYSLPRSKSARSCLKVSLLASSLLRFCFRAPHTAFVL